MLRSSDEASGAEMRCGVPVDLEMVGHWLNWLGSVHKALSDSLAAAIQKHLVPGSQPTRGRTDDGFSHNQ